MGLKTKKEYIESLRVLHPTAYMFGERVTNVVDNPRLRAGIEATGATYEIAELDEYRDLVVTTSPLINEPVNRFTLPKSTAYFSLVLLGSPSRAGSNKNYPKKGIKKRPSRGFAHPDVIVGPPGGDFGQAPPAVSQNDSLAIFRTFCPNPTAHSQAP